MRKEHAALRLLFSATAIALSGCSDSQQTPPPKTAAIVTEVRTRADATELFSDRIDWSDARHADSRAVLWSDLVDSGSSIEEMGAGNPRRSRDYEWFAAIDSAPGAYFRHPVSYAFITYSNPKLETQARKHLPTLDGQPLWATAAAFLRDANIVRTSCWLDRPPQRHALAQPAATFDRWPPRMATDHCHNERRAYAVLVHNLHDLAASPETRDNLDLMAQALRANGYAVIDFVSNPALGETMPYLNLAAERGSGILQLRNFVNIHQDFNDCCEQIVLYLTGQTGLTPAASGNEIFFELPFLLPREDKSRPISRRLYADEIAAALKDIKSCHLNVVVDSNDAALFADAFLALPHVESVVASCQESQFTYSSAADTLGQGAFVDPYSTMDGERGSEFTSSFAKGILDRAASRRPGEPPTPAHLLAQSGFEAVLRYDLAYLAAQTDPVAKARTFSSGCPSATTQPNASSSRAQAPSAAANSPSAPETAAATRPAQLASHLPSPPRAAAPPATPHPRETHQNSRPAPPGHDGPKNRSTSLPPLPNRPPGENKPHSPSHDARTAPAYAPENERPNSPSPQQASCTSAARTAEPAPASPPPAPANSPSRPD